MTAGKGTGGDYAAFKNEIDSGQIAPAYVLHGEESYLRDYCLRELKRALVPEGLDAFNYRRLEGKDVTVEALRDALEVLPVMSERTLVQVTDFDPFRLDEAGRAALAALLEDLPGHVCLAFVFDQTEYKPNRSCRRLCEAFSRYVREVDFTRQGQGELQRWVARRFRALGHTVSPETADYLVFLCGGLMHGLVPEIEKIGAYARGEEVTRADVDAVASPVLEAQVFDMARAVTKRDFGTASEVLGRLLALQEEPYKLLALLGRELRRLRTARIALDDGRDRRWLMEIWSMRSDYPARLLMDSARGVSRAWCDRAVERCCEADVRIKSVSGADGADELKLLLAELAREAAA